jgi:Histidine kinase-, DNA gyrase B-, and HSP90-like ATPase/IclR helix-turn-helix domain
VDKTTFVPAYSRSCSVGSNRSSSTFLPKDSEIPGFSSREVCGKWIIRSIQWRSVFDTCRIYLGGRPEHLVMSLEPSSEAPSPARQVEPMIGPITPVVDPSSLLAQDQRSAAGRRLLDTAGPLTAAEIPGFGPYDEPPRIAVYVDPRTPPIVVTVTDVPLTGEQLPSLIDALATRAYERARELGGHLPVTVFRELVENLVHASFAGAVVTILDHGNTVRVSDRGPGIPDKEAALRPGFTSADAVAKQFIRGVGSGFSVVRETLDGLDGTLLIEDNLGRGTVVTAKVSPLQETPLASTALPAYNLSERQLKTMLLTVELAPVGPTRIAQELGVSTSTAYRDLISLEDAGFVTCETTGRRSATESGLAYLATVL